MGENNGVASALVNAISANHTARIIHFMAFLVNARSLTIALTQAASVTFLRVDMNSQP